MTKTDSVAVLRKIRDRIEGCGDLSSLMKKPERLAALDAAIAALSAQGEAVAWSMFNEAAGRLTTLKSAVLKGLAELACLGEPDHLRSCFKRGHEWREELIERESVVKIIVRVRDILKTTAPAYPAPPGPDADVRALVDWIFSRFGAPFGDVELPEHIVAAVRRLEAALAARPAPPGSDAVMELIAAATELRQRQRDYLTDPPGQRSNDKGRLVGAAADRVDAALAALAARTGKGEAVGQVNDVNGFPIFQWFTGKDCPVGTKLYLHPAPPGSDAVTEALHNAIALFGGRCTDATQLVWLESAKAALAARTGKGEANG